MIEREVARDNSGERACLACWFWRSAKTNFQNAAVLFEKNRQIPNRPDKPIAGSFPVKHLAGIKALLEIEIRCKNLNHIREDNNE